MSVLRPLRGSRLPRLALLLAIGAFAGQALAGTEEDKRATDAVRVLSEIQKIPEQGIPDKLLDEGRAVVVIPDTLKVGLVIGGRRGHGLMSVKSPDGSWSQPVFVKLTGGSIGFQAGVQSSDVVLVFRNDRNLENIVNGKITLGADAGVAAGPVGRNASASTDGQLKAEIWSWSRARGLFAGVALDGAVLQIDDDANVAVYGSAATPRAIFESRAGIPSDAVVGFRDQLEEATAIARAARRDEPSEPSAPMAAPVTVTGSSASQPEVSQPQPATTEAQPQGFQPVADGEIRSEPLPTTP
ncbi:lipid-binding SYLF domain-containing protein [Pseudoxanthomonas sp. CF125]|uniref:lipid-binding SYLF domain-containing protein n=1 Tax=Pseudoxanthomonas sp. CF125 TaxID=1855303 RepID=UPI0008871CF8|nr:lipid-binding SYLF domain-containing protein [Pseudoxanthomonas sp. CF125]SDR11264.1 Lipid-binding SYLF domain-containing protein [Pseudoxanthomonas sp. CF125]